jgi:large subunit ribosomal protein L29
MSLKPSEIRKMNKEERREKLRELRNELLKLKMQAMLGTIDNPGKIRVVKKSIARILTIENEEKR